MLVCGDRGGKLEYIYICVYFYGTVSYYVVVWGLVSCTDISGHRSAPHHTTTTNKLDRKVDSDRDHRAYHVHEEFADGTQTTDYGGHESTNHGPHHTNVANKLDPSVDSDRDHRASHASTNYGPHPTDIGNKLDPRFDSDLDHRGPGSTNGNVPPLCELGEVGLTIPARRTSHEDLSRTETFSAPQRADTMPHLHHDCPASDPEGEELNSSGRYSRRESKTQHAPRTLSHL